VGYLLVADTSLQKIFLILGPRRSGKGTIGRIATALLGRDNVASPTLADFQHNFGLEPLIGTLLALISDARLGQGANHKAVVERLLAISGEDPQTIPRKYLKAWKGTLRTRFLILTNELPRLSDASGALPSRCVIIRLTKSFEGNEDPKLIDKLIPELPGIFNWSLEGLRRLRRRGHFVQPDASAELRNELETLGSPLRAFVMEDCQVGAGLSVSVAQLYDHFRIWAEEAGLAPIPDRPTFGRDLHAIIPTLHVSQPRVGDGRPRRYLGITLKSLARGGTRANPPRAHEEEGVEEEKNGGADRVPSRAAPIGDDVEEGIL
jgi:putative DNA primase/helicase